MSTASHHKSNRAFYDRISSAYDLIANANERQARLAGVRALDVRKGEVVLEVGFGTGNEIADLAELVGEAGRVAGIDISPGMLAVTERKLAGKNLPASLDLQVGDARRLPWRDGTFDAVYTSFTLELFPLEDIPAVLAECRRVLRQGGRAGVVSMATVKPGHHTSALERAYVWMHRHFPHLVDCQPIDVEGEVRKAGFEIAKVEEMEIWTMPVRAVVGRKSEAAA
jgi:demethylmenaquinone methyltransferase/2-methoxy-6-polyprenyl-1,4-benzoquinol methylase